MYTTVQAETAWQLEFKELLAEILQRGRQKHHKHLPVEMCGDKTEVHVNDAFCAIINLCKFWPGLVVYCVLLPIFKNKQTTTKGSVDPHKFRSTFRLLSKHSSDH